MTYSGFTQDRETSAVARALADAFTPKGVTAVEIVRPKRKVSEWLVMLIGGWIAVFASAATTMLLIGACHHEIDSRIPAFGYLQTLLTVYTLKTIASAVSPWDAYKLWTREHKS